MSRTSLLCSHTRLPGEQRFRIRQLSPGNAASRIVRIRARSDGTPKAYTMKSKKGANNLHRLEAKRARAQRQNAWLNLSGIQCRCFDLESPRIDDTLGGSR